MNPSGEFAMHVVAEVTWKIHVTVSVIASDDAQVRGCSGLRAIGLARRAWPTLATAGMLPQPVTRPVTPSTLCADQES